MFVFSTRSDWIFYMIGLVSNPENNGNWNF